MVLKNTAQKLWQNHGSLYSC